jgi:hypothetical protein
MNDRTVVTSIGDMTVPRRHYYCPACGGSTPWDAWAGVGHRGLTPGARRMATLAGMSWSFDRAERHLWEFCHLRISDDTIERVCQEEGIHVQKWMRQAPEPARDFQQAPGLAEFSTDGLKINTVEGWREMRISVWAKRQPCAPCAPQDWEQRVLHEPTVRVATCALATSRLIGASWEFFSTRLGLDEAPVSVLGDGAKWIWSEAAVRLSSHAQWCLDVFHNSEHLHACGKALHGEGPKARQWADGHLQHVLACNGPSLIAKLRQEKRLVPPAHHPALDGLLHYLEDNRDSMWYADRLRGGLPIGSGLIEGAAKNVLAARLKANSARWRVRRAERIGALRCLDYSDQWDAYWLSTAA